MLERHCVVCGLGSTRSDWQASTKPACDSHTTEEIAAASHSKEPRLVPKSEAVVHAALRLPPDSQLRDLIEDFLDLIEDLIELGVSNDILERLFEIILSIIASQSGGKAASAVLYFRDIKGELLMDVTVHLNDVALVAQQVEFDGPNGTGNIVPNIGPTSYTSADPTIATVDPVSGQLKYLKAGTVAISGNNSGNGLTSVGNLTIISGLAQSAEMQFVSAAAAAATKK